MAETLTPEHITREGQAAYQRGDYQAAARSFQAAAAGFKLAGNEVTAAEMANNGCVALLQAGQPAAALTEVLGTEACFAAAGDTRRQAMAVGNQAAALEALGRLEEAKTAYRQSAELLKQVGEMELRAYVMQSLSALELRTGQQLQAFTTMYAGVQGVPNPNPRQRILKKLLNIPFRLFGVPAIGEDAGQEDNQES